MLAIVAALILLERHGRRRQRYASTQRARAVQPRKLRGPVAAIAFILGWLPIIIGFVAPALYLLNETIKHFHPPGAVSDQVLLSGSNPVSIDRKSTRLNS